MCAGVWLQADMRAPLVPEDPEAVLLREMRGSGKGQGARRPPDVAVGGGEGRGNGEVAPERPGPSPGQTVEPAHRSSKGGGEAGWAETSGWGMACDLEVREAACRPGRRRAAAATGSGGEEGV
jgi:hypothetical protein